MAKKIEEIIAENVKALMAKLPSVDSNPKLAKKAQVGTGTISRVINAETSAGANVIDSIAKALGVTAADLMKENVSNISPEIAELHRTVDSLSSSGKLSPAEIKAMNEMLKARQ